MDKNETKITVQISNLYLFAAWMFGFFFTLGITMHANSAPLTFWEQLLVATAGYILWPGILGLYIAKLLGTY